MRESLKNMVVFFDDDMVVYPGHGSSSTMGDEKRHNPFLQFS
jgi:glyoxylase-like metal-dependent hydrolase (beta-lactamase superfamily II)